MKAAELLKTSKLSLDDLERILSPETNGYLFGTPGSQYFLYVTNLDTNQEATVSAISEDQYIINHRGLEPTRGYETQEPFTMCENGYISIFNTSPNVNYTPKVYFKLIPA